MAAGAAELAARHLVSVARPEGGGTAEAAQRAGQRLAVVLARDGSEVGVVALEDILKLMFGEVKL